MRIFITLLFISFVASAEDIKPFTSDGCSIFPDGTIEQKELWLSCCTAHDYAYWEGGTNNQRIMADEQLHQCVVNVGEANIATLMLSGVKVGGSPYFPTPFRWGYGWSYLRGYKPLTESEKKQVELIKKNEMSND